MSTTFEKRRTVNVLEDGTIQVSDVDDTTIGVSVFDKTTVASILSPDEISPANLELWLDASESATLNLSGSDVVDWQGRDEDLNQYNFDANVTVNHPQFVSGAINGQDAVEFNGTDTRMSNSVSSNFSFAHQNSQTLAVVLKATGSNPADIQAICSNSNSSGEHGIELVRDDSTANERYQYAIRRGVAGFANSTVGIQRDSFWDPDEWQYFIIVWDNSGDVCTTTHSVQGSVSDAELNDPSTDPASQNFFLGGRPNQTLFFDGQISQLIMWNVAISDSQVTGLSGYFAQQFAL